MVVLEFMIFLWNLQKYFGKKKLFGFVFGKVKEIENLMEYSICLVGTFK